MTIKLLPIILLILISGCSLQQPKNTWQYKSVTAFEKYQQYYLENHLILASSERKKAIAYAKQSAHLNTLARVYLGDCAIQYAALNKTQCLDFQETEPHAHDPELTAYFNLLTGQLTMQQVAQLPKRYQDFAKALLNNDSAQVQIEVMAIPGLYSKLIAASLTQSQLDLDTLRLLINETAEQGLQLASLRWMSYLADITPDAEESQQLKHKMALMTRLE